MPAFVDPGAADIEVGDIAVIAAFPLAAVRSLGLGRGGSFLDIRSGRHRPEAAVSGLAAPEIARETRPAVPSGLLLLGRSDCGSRDVKPESLLFHGAGEPGIGPAAIGAAPNPLAPIGPLDLGINGSTCHSVSGIQIPEIAPTGCISVVEVDVRPILSAAAMILDRYSSVEFDVAG